MKSALVVGATGTIGSALCRRLALDGFSIAPEWISKSRPDLSSEEAFASIPDDLDVAIFAAGVNAICPVDELSILDWNHVVDINLSSAFRFAQKVIRNIRNQNPKIVFISSIMANHPYPDRTAYAAAKGGLESLCRALAVESRGRYSTIAVRLGHIDRLMASTVASANLLPAVRELSPDKTLTSPEEVANLIVDILPHMSLINGAIIDADRGYTINRWPLINFRD